MATIAAGIAATAAGLTYLDGRYHIRQDLKMTRAKGKGAKMFQKAIQEKRISPYYFFEKHAQAQPSEECIWWRGGSYTWNAAYTRANQYAHFFLSQGVKPNDLVSLFMINSPDFVLAHRRSQLMFADGPDELLERLDTVQDNLLASGVRIVKLSSVRGEIEALPTTRPPDEFRAAVTPSSAFGLFYTSGTTGLPKACIVPATAGFMHGASRECGFAYVTPTSDNAALGRPERYYDCMPLYHGTGGISAMTQLVTGQTLCIAPKFSTSRFWDDVRASRATWFVYVGETLRYLLAASPSPLDKAHSVRAIYGNGLRPDVWVPFRERFGIETIHEFFNSTEGILPLDNPARGDFRAHSVGHHGFLSRWRFRNVLVPVAIDAETGDIARDAKTGFATRVPYEVGGEILVRQPPTVTPAFPGYFKNEEETIKKYVYDVFRKGDCYYRTGDALRRDTDGRWFFLDRLGDTFRWKGENVSTAEVSEVLGRYPGVSEATVYGVSLPGHDGKAGMAAVYINSEASNFDYKGLLNLNRYFVIIIMLTLLPFDTHINTRPVTPGLISLDKVPLKKAGVDPAQMNGDLLFWISENGKGDEYVPFASIDFESLQAGRAKL
ncbi:hypothetical protein E0Z10_g5998 [Xylaria hypoxylon]|uniref:AMP-dependent synthetase/ligase domain-containing protein n=1 Tax=Xylaria hypoxylon TaxID=37992 RepID=A0A4Z0YWF5_9PEZI|nr:hypothetical protein E0Z10_g5998 [Xylaria hypoxylon]